MQRQRHSVETAGCEPCPAFMGDDGSTACVGHFSIIPSRMAAQVTDGVWNAVVTTLGKGTFLIRHATNLPANACPLRAYEIRYIEVVSSPVRKRVCRDQRAQVFRNG